jgi:hypothetical protein
MVHLRVLKVPEKQVCELGSRIKERSAGNEQSARPISQTSLFHRPHSDCQFGMRLNGTPWSKNVFRIALLYVLVAFPIAQANDAGRVASVRQAPG